MALLSLHLGYHGPLPVQQGVSLVIPAGDTQILDPGSFAHSLLPTPPSDLSEAYQGPSTHGNVTCYLPQPQRSDGITIAEDKGSGGRMGLAKAS